MASFPGSVKTFTTKNNLETIQPSHVNDLQDEVSAIESGILTGTAPLSCSNVSVQRLIAGGDVYSVPLTDYSSLATVSGYSSYSGTIYYKKIGKQVQVSVSLTGASNSSLLTVTLPYTAAIAEVFGLPQARDGGVYLSVPGLIQLVAGSSLVRFFTSMSGAAWSTSGAKDAAGSFIFEAST